MLEITADNIIRFTRSDTLSFAVNLFNADGTPYEMQDGDKLWFTIRRTPNEDAILCISSATNVISINAVLTIPFEPGKYCYDIELDKGNGSEIYTIVGIKKPSERNLIVYPEVTTNESKQS